MGIHQPWNQPLAVAVNAGAAFRNLDLHRRADALHAPFLDHHGRVIQRPRARSVYQSHVLYSSVSRLGDHLNEYSLLIELPSLTKRAGRF
jgi:hypothetical protein